MLKFFFQGRDLSQVTDRLWKRFYQIEFGDKSINQVVERMKQRKVTFKWKQLYEVIYHIIFCSPILYFLLPYYDICLVLDNIFLLLWLSNHLTLQKSISIYLQAKSKEVEETQQRSFERIKELYQNENASMCFPSVSLLFNLYSQKVVPSSSFSWGHNKLP